MIKGKKRQRSLKRNATLNIIKQICSILFPMVTFPYASRVLGRYSYGKINFSSSIVSYISMIAALGVTAYATREGARIREDKKSTEQFASEVFSINVISTIVAYIVLLLLILFWNRLDGYTILLLIQSSSILFTTIGTDWINSIYEDYLYPTVRYIICQSIVVILMLALVRDSRDYMLYAFSSVIGSIIANSMNVFYIRRKYDVHIRFTVHLNVRRHFKPIMILFGTSVATLIYINSDVTILGILRDEKEVGLYSVSAKIYSLVKGLINAMMVVAIPRISNEIKNGDNKSVNHHLGEILDDLLIVVGPACVGLMMLAENIVVLFSGASYAKAYTSLEILSVSLIFATIASYYINVVMIPYRMEKQVLIATITSACINIVLNIVLIPSYGQNAAALTTLISEMIMTVMGVIYSRKKINLKCTRSLITGIFGSVVTFIICYVVLRIVTGNFITIVLSVVLSVIACTITVYLIDKEKFESLAGDVIQKIRKDKL